MKDSSLQATYACRRHFGLAEGWRWNRFLKFEDVQRKIGIYASNVSSEPKVERRPTR